LNLAGGELSADQLWTPGFGYCFQAHIECRSSVGIGGAGGIVSSRCIMFSELEAVAQKGAITRTWAIRAA
jgi:hypothetical protein